MKNTRGITLISLVVTIVILLILVGVVLNLTLGEYGIISKTKQATQQYINAQVDEQEKLNSLNLSEEYILNNGSDTITTSSNSLDLLWTNPNPNISFEPQAIQLDLSKYVAVLIYVKARSDISDTVSSTNYTTYAYGKIGETTYCVGVSKGTAGWFGTFRPVQISSNAVTFGQGTYGQGANTYSHNGVGGIPIYIWGTKNDLYSTE